ncbi:o-succinylbenzoate synthase [Branchiibius hedensis]|uniref:o-succinylbenzoate synthase n=1 Tax=Branchiibius hedensis TaxID=672460 RepID=UPI000D6D78A0|nr:o-succinylbenzoate synthase [Branchiibius hedensis]
MVSLQELQESAHVVSIPLRTRFRGVDHREAMILRGPSGDAEFAPFLEYDAAESARWLAAAIEASWGSWPAPVRDSIPVNATVPAVSAAEVAGVLARYDGCTTAKVKVAERGQALEDDVARVAEVRSILGPSGRIRVDANGGWSLDDAVWALTALSGFELEYAEQPCATIDELASLRIALVNNGVDLRVAADESIRKATDPLLVARRHAADVAVVKVAPLGGVQAALDIAVEAALPTVVSSALDTSIGIAAGVALAAALPSLEFACGLGTVELLSTDVTSEPLVPRAGAIDVRRPLADRFSFVPASPERESWWRERLAAAYAEL